MDSVSSYAGTDHLLLAFATHEEANGAFGAVGSILIFRLVIQSLVEWHELSLYDGRLDYVVIIVLRSCIDSLRF